MLHSGEDVFVFTCKSRCLEMICSRSATRAMYSLLQRGMKLGLSIDIKLQLFDSLIVPICLYGCEVWGFKNIELIEKLHLQYCKSILHVNKSTPTCMVLGDLGRKRIEHM